MSLKLLNYMPVRCLLEDLIGEGNVALAVGTTMLGCLEKPSEVQGMLGKLIMDAMETFIAENVENEKADQKVADKVNKVMDAAKELSELLRRKVTVEELAAESKMSEKQFVMQCVLVVII